MVVANLAYHYKMPTVDGQPGHLIRTTSDEVVRLVVGPKVTEFSSTKQHPELEEYDDVEYKEGKQKKVRPSNVEEPEEIELVEEETETVEEEEPEGDEEFEEDEEDETPETNDDEEGEEVSGEEGEGDTPTDEDEKPTYTKDELMDKTRDQLDTIATGLGLNPDDYRNKDLISDAILEA